MPRNSTAYRDFLAKMRDPKVAKKTHGVMPVKMMKDARFVIDRVLKSWQEIVAASPKTRESLGRALKRIYGINFKQLQKEARTAYIEQHCNKPDRVLMKTLGIKSSATMTALTNELRAQDRLPKVARVTMTKAHGVTFERHARPFEIIMLIKWFPVSASLTAKQLETI